MNQIPVLICALFLLMFFHNASSCIFSLAALWWEGRLALWSQGLFLSLFEAFQLCHLRTESVTLAGELEWLMHLWAKISLSWNWKSSGLFFLFRQTGLCSQSWAALADFLFPISTYCLFSKAVVSLCNSGNWEAWHYISLFNILKLLTLVEVVDKAEGRVVQDFFVS